MALPQETYSQVREQFWKFNGVSTVLTAEKVIDATLSRDCEHK